MNVARRRVRVSSNSQRHDEHGASQRGAYPHSWPERGDWVLAAGQEPPRGAHLVTPRRGYVHHGIYVGNGMVVHYGGLAHGWQRGPVQEVTLARFAHGRPVCVRRSSLQRYDCNEVVRRARSRVGENRYRLLTNNCEHFCEWCICGQHRSQQVEYWFSQPRRMLFAVLGMLFPSPSARTRTVRAV